MSDREFLQKLGSNIRAIRKEQQISVERMSELCQLGENAIRHIEFGRRGAKILTLKKIADVLNISMNDLFN